MKLFKLSVIAIAAITIAACCPCRKTGSVPSIDGKTWTLIRINSEKVSASNNYTLTFDRDGKVSGTGDCNKLNGSYEITPEGKFSINGIASTRMMCPNQDMETKFIKALESVNGYAIDTSNGILMLLKDGQAILMLETEPTNVKWWL